MNNAHSSPYQCQPPRAFWKTAVAERDQFDPGDLYVPKFTISRTDRIVTAGSCFAQHVGRTLRHAGFNVLDAEPLPEFIRDECAYDLGYRLFSARYGNIYTVRQLLQLVQEAAGQITPALPVWKRGDRFFDAQRPNIEPDGFETEKDVIEHRRHHLSRVYKAFSSSDLFVFTFGLTETWRHRDSGTVYPTAPGTIAGQFDPEIFEFHNFDVFEVLADFETFREIMLHHNPGIQFLVTVSPVPLTATASANHVEVATTYSKSVLRAVCGMLEIKHKNVSYFPSFEVITSQKTQGAYYLSNFRGVSEKGVETAMRLFMEAHSPQGYTDHIGQSIHRSESVDEDEDVVCEEALLEAFAK